MLNTEKPGFDDWAFHYKYYCEVCVIQLFVCLYNSKKSRNTYVFRLFFNEKIVLRKYPNQLLCRLSVGHLICRVICLYQYLSGACVPGIGKMALIPFKTDTQGLYFYLCCIWNMHIR